MLKLHKFAPNIMKAIRPINVARYHAKHIPSGLRHLMAIPLPSAGTIFNHQVRHVPSLKLRSRETAIRPPWAEGLSTDLEGMADQVTGPVDTNVIHGDSLHGRSGPNLAELLPELPPALVSWPGLMARRGAHRFSHPSHGGHGHHLHGLFHDLALPGR